MCRVTVLLGSAAVLLIIALLICLIPGVLPNLLRLIGALLLLAPLLSLLGSH